MWFINLSVIEMIPQYEFIDGLYISESLGAVCVLTFLSVIPSKNYYDVIRSLQVIYSVYAGF